MRLRTNRLLKWLRKQWQKSPGRTTLGAITALLALSCSLCTCVGLLIPDQSANNPPPTEKPSPTGTATARPTAMPTEPNTHPPPTEASSPTETQPTANLSECTPGATFQRDVTIPDDTRVEIGDRFTKKWEIRNTGTCDWGPDFQFQFIDGDQMNAPDTVDVPITAAGNSAEIAVTFTAPQEPGRYRSTWRVCLQSQCFGDQIYTQIIAFDPTKPTAAPTQPPATSPSTQPPAAVCQCHGDLYNCSDFTTHRQAQTCFNYCINQGRGDIHRLDRDNNGIACESLP